MAQEAYLPDGNVAKLPDYSLESTQQEILKILQGMIKADSKAYGIYEQIIDEAKKQTKQTDKNAKEADKDRNKNNKLQEELLEETKKNGGLMSKVGAGVSGAFGLAASAVGFFGNQLLGLGAEINRLTGVGAGLDDQTGTTEKLIADMNYLGISTQDAAAIMGDFSGVVNTMGKTEFAKIQQAFVDISDSGLKFGLSLEQSSRVLAEDLEMRQMLGVLGQVDNRRQAQRSTELYQAQLKQTKLLGVSIDDIRKAGKAFVEENQQAQLSIMAIAGRLDPEAAADLTRAFESTAGSFAAMGVDPNLANEMMNMMVDPAAMLSEDVQDMMVSFQQLGKGGADVSKALTSIQADMTSGDPDRIKKAQARMASMPDMLADFANGLTPDELERFKTTLSAFPNSMAKGLVASLGPLKTAVSNRSKAENAVINDLAKGSQAFENARSTVMGTLQGTLTDTLGIFAEPMGAFADALTKDTILRDANGAILDKNNKAMTYANDVLDENGNVIHKQGEAIKDVNDLNEEQKKQMTGSVSIMTVFRDAVQSVRNSVMEGFGEMMGSTSNFSNIIQDKIIPVITRFTKSILNFVNEVFSADDPLEVLREKFTEIMDTKIKPAIGSLFSSIGSALLSGIGSLFTSPVVLGAMAAGIAALWAKNKLMSAISGGKGGTVTGSGGSGIANIGEGAGKAINGLAKGLSGAVSSLADGLKNAVTSLATGLKNVFVALAEGIGQGVAALGKGIGTALGAILKGLAGGLAAFANPAILIGAGILGGAITLIGAGIAGAAWIMGKALPTFAEGLESFANIDGDNLVNVAKGIGAIGLAMAAMGAGSAAGSIGTAVSGVVDGIAGFFGADDPLDKINEFAAYEFDVDKVVKNANAVKAFGEAMAVLGGGSAAGAVGGMMTGIAGFFEADPMSTLLKFSETALDIGKIDHNITAIDRIRILLEKYSTLPTDFTPIQMPTLLEDPASSATETTEQSAPEKKSTIQRRRETILSRPYIMSGNKTNTPSPSAESFNTTPSPTPSESESNKTMTSGSKPAGMDVSNKDVVELLTSIRNELEKNNRNVRRTGRATEDAIRESF